MFSDRLKFTVKIADKAGEFLLKNLNNIQKNEIYFKSEKDIVTEIDKKTEEYIVQQISEKYSDDDILAEENTNINNTKKGRWIIDPIDGTTNYLHGIPFFSISIGYKYGDEIVLGVIHMPKMQETFCAEKGKGSYLNGERISVTDTSELINSIGVTGFACLRANKKDNNLANFVNLSPKLRGIRRFGSAASDFCYVACGRVDFFWEKYLQPWDVTAGILIVREAGGTVTDFSGNHADLNGREIIASNGKLHKILVDEIK